ncbi:MAG: hypothetical protein OXH29_11115 [bacterium]|nr:hypothetical protein [bacterium]
MKRLLLMLLGIGLVIAGCGEGDVSDSSVVITVEDPEAVNPVDLVLSAVEQTETLQSFRADYVLKITGMPFIGDIVQPITIVQAANGDNSIEFDLSEATIDGEAPPPDLVEYVFEMRQVGDLLYITMPEEEMGKFANTPWVSIAKDQVTEDELDYFESFDPKEQLNYLLGVDKDATISLGEKVEGVTATRIRGVSTFGQMLAALDAEEQQEMIDSIASDLTSQSANSDEVLSSFETLEFEFDVWISEEGYVLHEIVVIRNLYEVIETIDPTVREMREVFEDLEMSLEIRYFDHGALINITAPPPEDVTPYTGSLDELLS